MTENPRPNDPIIHEADAKPVRRSPGTGANGHRPPHHPARGVPGIDLRTLIAERNYPALFGLGLLALGVLLIVQNVLGLSFSLWSLMLFAIGGWIMADAWQNYQQQGRTWTQVARNRMLAGGLVVLIALMGMVDLNWWGLLLMAAGGWLGYDTWQRYEAAGRTLTPTLRNRAWVAGAIGLIGFFGFFSLGSAWPLVLIVIGGAMLYRHLSH